MGINQKQRDRAGEQIEILIEDSGKSNNINYRIFSLIGFH
jgi:hypothetical protein